MAIEDEHASTGTRPRQTDKYHGQRDFLLLGNWIFSVDQYFILTDMPAHKQGPFVSTLLRDEASLSNYETWDPATALTWSILRASMREYFAPPNEDRRLQDEWGNLKQYGTVFEYVSVRYCERRHGLNERDPNINLAYMAEMWVSFSSSSAIYRIPFPIVEV